MYVSSVRINGNVKHLGYFLDEQSAFQAYKKAKEAYIKEVARDYFDKIDRDVYDALLNYTVVNTNCVNIHSK